MEERYDEGHWAPVVIETLINISVYPRLLRQSHSTDWALATLMRAQMITSTPETQSTFTVTPRGVAHIAQLCSHPYPKEQPGWINPLTKQPIKGVFQ